MLHWLSQQESNPIVTRFPIRFLEEEEKIFFKSQYLKKIFARNVLIEEQDEDEDEDDEDEDDEDEDDATRKTSPQRIPSCQIRWQISNFTSLHLSVSLSLWSLNKSVLSLRTLSYFLISTLLTFCFCLYCLTLYLGSVCLYCLSFSVSLLFPYLFSLSLS